MIKKIFMLSMMLLLIESQYSVTQCTCQDILSQDDCNKNIQPKCSWDTQKNVCDISSPSTNPTVDHSKQYCNSISIMECPNTLGCALVKNNCTFFTGCTPFAKTLDSECQAISNKCITDGTHCVEIDECSSYKKQPSCTINSAKDLCYWDTTNNTCVDANTCDKLPATFTTDKDCRNMISTCTTKAGGGCVDSGNNCTDQTIEIQCVWNKLRTIACYWDGTVCKDRICYNAPTSLTTDETCKTFRTDGSCTTKASGGCEIRTACAAATIQASCIKNSSGSDCYWTGTVCVDKTCADAPVTMTTNSACAGFVTGCITKTGGGCITNGACSVANVQAACVKNSSNFDCIWDTTCKEKTCANAPIAIMSHDMCTSYLSTCTVKSGGGCQNRTCENAPKTIKKNDECEEYLTGNNCITKTGGGCVINTTCSVITLEAACVKNSTAQTCFWDTASSSCKDKTCTNALATNTTHDLCQGFLNICTVNLTKAGCVEKTCENSLVLAICDKDTSNRACIWKRKCYKKQCALASSATTTHAECQTYHSSCTLSNSGTGCVPLPLKCEAITLEAACQMKSNKKPCGWNGSQCIDKDCSTASKTFTTTTQCIGHISTCVANNLVTVNGSLTIQGCQDLPTTCAARKSSENCEIARFGFPTCLWVSSLTSCVEKSCTTASTVGTTGVLSTGGFTFSGCQTYLNTCISNNTADGCIAKPSSCSSLVSSNCQVGSKASGDCYWNGSSCVDKTCANIIQTTHSNCNNTQNSCTVNNGGTACQPLATACTSYSTQENCKFTSTNKNCVWTGLVCRNATCADAPDTVSYDSDPECFAYQTPSETCTVVYKVGALGCVPKSANCSDYMTSAQCHKTVTNLTANDDCKWIVDRCYALSSFATGACTTFKGTQTMCQGYRMGCTNTVGAAASASCTLDCTLKTGTGLTFADCQALDSTCSVKKDGTGCIVIQSTCAGYGSTAPNCFRSRAIGNAGYCVLNTNCQAVTQASECALVTGLTGLDHSKCQLYHTSCTSLKDGTGCQEYKTVCSGYATGNTCGSSAQGKCYDDTASCLRFSNCASITGTGLTNTICSAYDTGCVVNVNGTACQEKLATCAVYLTQNTCSVSTASLCAWSGTASLTIVTACLATECPYVTGTSLTDAICATYHESCTANRAGTACQKKEDLCATYASFQATCSVSAAGPCAWSGTACLTIVTACLATECPYVTGTGLTDTICATYHESCTANRAGTACQEQLATCAVYTAEATCSVSTASLCAWSGTACLTIVTACLATECPYVTGTGLTDTICATYHAGCTANRAGTACQKKEDLCEIYTYYDYQNQWRTCSVSIEGQCFWSGTGCISVTNVAYECAYIIGTTLTNVICASYHADCIANRAGTACQEKKATCNDYATEATCLTSKSAGLASVCIWSDMVCFPFTNVATYCAYVTGTGLSDAICASYNAGCISLKDGSGCQEAKPNCIDYTIQNQCSTQTTGPLKCLWIDNSCYPIAALNCSAITGIDLDHDQCQAYSLGCTSVSDGTKCQDFKSNCEQYPGTFLYCTRTTSSKCYLYDSTCITIANSTTDCPKIAGLVGTITYEICQSYHIGCSVNRKRSACVQQQARCSVYTVLDNCYRSWTGLCISSTITGIACVAAQTAKICDAVYLGTGNYSSANCNKMKPGCTNNGTTACVARTCANAVFIFNHANCNNWLQQCTVNSESTACQTMTSKCADQPQASCLYSFEGECVVIGTSCVRKTCDTAPTNPNWDDDSECSSYLQSCTVARLGGCQARAACTTYKSSIQCKFNSSGGKCFWNPTQQICVDLDCNNIEQSTKYDTHNECVAVDAALACTVRTKDGDLVKGCMDRGACSSYSIEEQCKTNASGDVCVWNANLSVLPCQDKSCSTAPTSTITHNDCYAYYNTVTVKCTVAATLILYGSNPTLGGCQQTAACSSYIDKEQCQINANGDPCGWNGILCADKSCATAPATANYDDDTKCRAYIFNKCTVSGSGQGCVDIPITCETMTQKQCYYNKAGDPCYWTGTTCITRSCENAPDLIVTADECNTYLAGCTLDSIKCKVKVCEDFQFASDALCKQSISTCTTNGSNCVTRGSCLQALDKAGCILSSTGKICEWIPEIDLKPAYCTIKNCFTAPNSLKTENQCQEYFLNCTTKKGGGCVIKTSCQAATVEGACTTAVNGQVCVWDIIQQLCRDQDCQDLDGTSHAVCRTRKSDCTIGANRKCAKAQNCEQTKVRTACIEGLNGPCLWIDKFINQDDSKGACFQYTSCQSLNWISDKQCKQISDNCTTDGNKCVAITLCSETNTKGGCVTGYDGHCIQSVPALYSLDPEVCQLYTSCENAFYLTHEQCQQANSNCTTNGTTGCIKLDECSSYLSKDGCVINKYGLQFIKDDVTKSKDVISTGLCTWNAKDQNCRDQICSDYQNSTHQECSAILSTCTSDGQTCILKGICSSYTSQNSCETAVGSDGICFWEVQLIKNIYITSCRLFTCQDIQNSIYNNVCLTSSLDCVLDFNICIPKANCSTYKSKTACNSGGLDGICVFTQNNNINATSGIGTCSLMIECESANNDSNACQAAKDRCFWKFKSTTSTQGQCSPLDCNTNQQQNGHCTRFFKWDKQSQKVCSFQNGICSEINPIILSQSDCFTISGFTYTWNASNNKCQACNTPKPNSSSNNESTQVNENEDENETSQSTSSKQILSKIGIIMMCYILW